MKTTISKALFTILFSIILKATAFGQVAIGSPGLNATISCPAVPTFTAPTASSTCGGVTVNVLSNTTSGNTCSTVFTRTWDAVDDCGNTSATVSQTITTVDFTAPTIGPPGANLTIDCTATPIFTPPTATDACNGATVNLLASLTSGNACTRTVTRQWDAVDACGNHSATRTQNITVFDPPPTIGPPGANATIDCTATPIFTPPTATDGCNGATVNLLVSLTSGNACTRTVTRQWDAVDACGNHSATRTQNITVFDPPPTIGPPGANATIDCTATPVFTPPTAADGCNGATVNLLASLTSASACTRTVTREWDAVDACGNHSATRTQSITVTDFQPPKIGPAGANATIICGATPVFTPPTASDNCGTPTLNEVTTTNGSGCFQTITKRWFAVDACGHSSDTVSQTITIRRNLIKVPIDFVNIMEVIQYLDTNGITAPTIIELEPDYASSTPIVIGKIPGSSATNTLTIRPAPDASELVIGSPRPIFDVNALTFFLPPPRLVTMDLQNASNVIIDGRPGGVGTQSQLTIQNFSVAGNAVRFIYGSNNNCIKYCALEGVNAPSNFTNSPAVVLFDSTGTKSDPFALGALNTKDSILNCTIRGIGDSTPIYNAVYSSGINDLNGNNFISNNQVADFSNAGVFVSPIGNGGNWTIAGNSFYYDLPSPATTPQTAIQFVPGASSDDNVISDNFIGGTASNAAGGAWTNNGADGVARFTGIKVEAGITTGAAVHRNIVRNVSVAATENGSATGAELQRLASNDGNIIGSPDNPNSIQVSGNNASFTGILVNSALHVSVTNDEIANVAVTGSSANFTAVRKAGSGPIDVGNLHIHHISAPTNLDGIVDEGSGDATIYGNKIEALTGGAGSDILITRSTNSSSANLSNNILSGNSSFTGVHVNVLGSASLALTAQNDTITGFSKGFLLEKATAATLTTSIFDNAITGNTTGVDNETGTPTNATCNWWGSASGPAAGQITGNVIYSPWATISQYVSVSAGADQTIYIGFGPQSVTLNANTVTCGTPQYHWSTGATSQSIVASPTITTNYIVTVGDAAGHMASDTVTVFVVNANCGNNNDKVLMCHKGGTICIKKADVADHLKQGDQLGPCAPGAITQSRTNGEGSVFEKELTVYPNPATAAIQINWFAREARSVLIQIFDVTGRKVAEQKVVQSPGTNERTVILSKLSNGTYFLRVPFGKEIRIARFMISKR